MKKLLLLVLLFISVVANAQKGISYQAIILDPSKIEIPGQDISGQPFVNGNVSVKFVILSGTTSQFEEVQQTKTDAYGLVNLTIGSAANTAFNALTWDANQKSLQVFVSFNNGASYTKVSDQKLTYNPYTLFAETAGKLGSTLGIAGGGTGATTAVGARANLGLGNVDNTSDAAKPISTATQAALDLKANAADVNSALALKATVAALQAHMAITADTSMLATKAALTDLNNYAPKASPTFTGTVSGIDKSMVGLGSVDNTSDLAKPISTATQAALDLKANASNVSSSLASKASLISPSLTGIPTAPTAAPGTNSTQIATTAFTTAAIATATAGASSGVADNSVTSMKIADGSIITVDIANGAVSDAKIQTVSGSKITGVIPVLSGGTGLSSFGLNGQVLTSTGGGTMTWTTASSGGGSGVPYTGATSAVNLGAYDLTVNGVSVGKGKNNSITTNTVLGNGALANPLTSDYNTAIGHNALNVNGANSFGNTAVGANTLTRNTAPRNTAVGESALQRNVSGESNTAVGEYAISQVVSGSNNTGIGNFSLAANLGNQNSALGAGADVSANTPNISNATAIGFDAKVATSNTVQLGNSSVTSVKTNGSITAGSVTYPNTDGANGQLLSTNGAGNLTWTSIGGFTHYIGENFGGGIIVYVWKTNGIEHGLISTKTDLLSQNNTPYTLTWSSNANTNLSSGATSLNDGQANTATILLQDNITITPAKLCNDLIIEGFDDWYLPSVSEFSFLYLQKDLFDFYNATSLNENGSYCTSTETGSDRVYAFRVSSFSGGKQAYYGKGNSFLIRAFRQF